MLEKRNGFELEIQQMIQQAIAEKSIYEQKKHDAERRLEEIEGELLAYEHTLNAYRRRQGKPIPKAERLSSATLRQMSVGQGMEALLRESGGKEKIAVIARRLLEAGKLKNKRTANSHVRGVMHRDSRFVFLGDATIGLAK